MRVDRADRPDARNATEGVPYKLPACFEISVGVPDGGDLPGSAIAPSLISIRSTRFCIVGVWRTTMAKLGTGLVNIGVAAPIAFRFDQVFHDGHKVVGHQVGIQLIQL